MDHTNNIFLLKPNTCRTSSNFFIPKEVTNLALPLPLMTWVYLLKNFIHPMLVASPKLSRPFFSTNVF